MDTTILVPLSTVDRPGYIYCYHVVEDRNGIFLFKVGQTCRALQKRIKEWGWCSSREQEWYLDTVWVDRCHKVKHLVHLALIELGFACMEEYCAECDIIHIEIFGIPNANAWRDEIKPLIEDMDCLVNWMY
ncbi:hypothetical protein Moror_15096 [Moniliophthora roreri MCA 2997]|uniref:Bacteriophage T5 Orf172 DNA-binding domain-containing protein n=2 Tax=Moniliophthora roreri TaxID=221103 RepID=V2Y596_MONRO|nr:hypothetical protein Moror_15096 [Moniliophthora roreri MCA 2997]KAI3605458.1 hypothetical protein WG66_005925 [Moniliophthora roreri]